MPWQLPFLKDSASFNTMPAEHDHGVAATIIARQKKKRQAKRDCIL
jgi:hypothetical protein